MKRMPSARVMILALALAAVGTPAAVAAQSFETLGTRAAGMGGAFVAVADDATATYWNPAGLATSGRLFNLSIDWSQGHAEPETTVGGLTEGERSAGFAGIVTPPLGFSYYGLAQARLSPGPSTNGNYSYQLQNLVTHNAGITLVQSIASRVALGTTLRYVRGEVASAPSNLDADDLLDKARELPTIGTNKFDADVGVMAMLGPVRAGLTVRNLREPEFSTGANGTIQMKRQSRLGVAYVGLPGLVASADIDLERTDGSIGEERNVAAGVEAHLFPRVFARGGFRVNTLETNLAGPSGSDRATVYTLGGSVITVRSLIVDAQVTLGSKTGDRGWGIAGRFTY